uniref:Interleukin 23 receptor n=1 Tax=Pseudonaja textilis TaxID=8673 RepID=A0A670YK56_PSETE
MRLRQLLSLVLLVTCCSSPRFVIALYKVACMGIIKCSGRVWVEPAPIIQMGQNISINCHCMEKCQKGKLSLNLNNADVEDTLLSVINQTTVQLNLQNYNEPFSTVSCLLKSSRSRLICGTQFCMGYLPDKPANLTCIKPEQLDNMVCTWKSGKKTHLNTNYILYVKSLFTEENKGFVSNSSSVIIPLNQLQKNQTFSISVHAENYLGGIHSEELHVDLNTIAVPVVVQNKTMESPAFKTIIHWKRQTAINETYCEERYKETISETWHLTCCVFVSRVNKMVSSVAPKWLFEEYPKMQNSKVIKYLQENDDETDNFSEPFLDVVITEVEEILMQNHYRAVEKKNGGSKTVSEKVSSSEDVPFAGNLDVTEISGYKPQTSNKAQLGTTFSSTSETPVQNWDTKSNSIVFPISNLKKDYTSPVASAWPIVDPNENKSLFDKISLILKNSGSGQSRASSKDENPSTQKAHQLKFLLSDEDIQEQTLIPDSLFSCLKTISEDRTNMSYFPQNAVLSHSHNLSFHLSD